MLRLFPLNTLADLILTGAKNTRQIVGSMYQPPERHVWDEETQMWIDVANPDLTPGACAMGDAYIGAGADMARSYDIDNDWDGLLATALGITRDELLSSSMHFHTIPDDLYREYGGGRGYGTYLDAVFWMNDRDQLSIERIVEKLRHIHTVMQERHPQA